MAKENPGGQDKTSGIVVSDVGSNRKLLGFVGRRKALLISCLIIVLVGGAIFYGFILQKLASRAVCSDEFVARYNAIITSGDETNFDNEVKQLAAEAESQDKYDEDPTCLLIVYNYHSQVLDSKKSRELLDKYKTAIAAGKSPDGNLTWMHSVEQMESFVKSLEDSELIGDDADGSG